MNGDMRKQIASLYRCKPYIIQDLDVEDVVSELLTGLVITYKDKQLIFNEGCSESKAERLLTILEEKASDDEGVIPYFVETLKTKYNWIYRKFTEDVPDSRVVPLLPDQRTASTNNNNLVADQNHSTPSHKRILLQDERFPRIFEIGRMPSLPAVTIERKKLLKEVQTELQKLEKGYYLVLHGMAGSGKSVMTTQCIQDSTEICVCDLFPGGIFWLTIGKECSDSKDALFGKLRILCEQLLDRTPNSLEHGADILRTAILNRGEKKMLIVLDDVWRSEVIKAFDVGCATVVTTRDTTVMDVVPGKYKSIQVDVGFSFEESMEMFSRSLEMSEKDLPKEAELIHSHCKGTPMVISLIASLMREFDASDQGRWKYYLDSLTQRKYSSMNLRGFDLANIVGAISLSFEELSEEHKSLYMDFAMFQEDLGIPCAVFMTLWGMQKYEVENIMKIFVRKSLIKEELDSSTHVYTYFIHDLLLDYLKTQIANKNFESELHKKLLDRYLDVCNGEWHKLPDDGYIHFNIGHHIYKSKQYQYFPKVYFDLLFIGEKLRISGPADLLVDIRKYLDFLVANCQKGLQFVEELQSFAQLVGHRVYGKIESDIVQIALQSPHLTWINAEAKRLAQKATSTLYFEWKNADQWKHPESTVLCGDQIRCVKFIGHGGSHFLAGLESGTIQICDLESSSICHVLYGHSNTVNSLALHPVDIELFCENSEKSSYLRVLSTSLDGTCKLWDVKSVLLELESRPYELKTGKLLGISPSPKLRPEQQWAFFDQPDQSEFTFSLHSGPVNHAEFTVDGSLIASVSTNEIIVWESSSKTIRNKFSINEEGVTTFQRLVFPLEKDPEFLLASAENKLILFSMNGTHQCEVDTQSTRVVSLLSTKQHVVSVGENEIRKWNVVKGLHKAKKFRSHSLSPSKCVSFLNDASKNTQTSQLTHTTTLDPDMFLTPELLEEKNSRHAGMNTLQLPLNQNNVDFPTSNLQNFYFHLELEDTITCPTSALILCAAITTKEDGYKNILACGTFDHKIFLWEVFVGGSKFLGSFTSHNGWVTCLDFSSVDVSALLSGSEDHTVMIWDIQNEEQVKDAQRSLLFSSVLLPNDSFISTLPTLKHTVQIFRDYKLVHETLPINSAISAIQISTCGEVCAIGCASGEIFKLCLRNLEGSVSKPLGIKQICNLKHKVEDLVFGDDDKDLLVACAANGEFSVIRNWVKVLEVQVSKSPAIRSFIVFQNYALCIAQDSTVIMMNVLKKSWIPWKSDFDYHITCCDLASCTLAMGTSSSDIILLSLSPDKIISKRTLTISNVSSPIRSIAFSADSMKLAVGCDSGLISVWCLKEDSYSKERDLVVHKTWVRQLKFSPKGSPNWLISCGDSLAVWSLDKVEAQPRRFSFMAERRRRRSGDSPARNSNRLSLEIPSGMKIGKQGKRELLQQFSFRGNYARKFETDNDLRRVLVVDDSGMFYFLEVLQ